MGISRLKANKVRPEGDVKLNLVLLCEVIVDTVGCETGHNVQMVPPLGSKEQSSSGNETTMAPLGSWVFDTCVIVTNYTLP